MTIQSAMLAFARDAILNRAASDGYKPGEYDAVSDYEGYVTSLLIALRHWCHAHSINWADEIAQAQQYFEEDLEESSDVPLVLDQ